MSPAEEVGDFAGWKAGLLARIQHRSVEHARLLYRGYPDYDPASGRGEIAVATWRRHLSDLEADRRELVVRAAASGIPDSMITAAIDNGAQGRRWGESARNPPTTRYGQDPVRAEMIAQIAEDMWTLEHMAALDVDRGQRGLATSTDTRTHNQYLANMDALWRRVDLTTAVAQLDDAERGELWGRDSRGWRRLIEVSVAGYEDTDIETLWRAHAWPGIAQDVHRTSDNLAADVDRGDPHRTRPPTPTVLIDRARDGLDHLAHATYTDPGIDHVLHAALTAPTSAADAGSDPLEHSTDTTEATIHEIEF